MDATLVRFEYAPSAPSPWAAAGYDVPAYGAALDCVLDKADIHLLEHFASISDASLVIDDPLVALADFVEGVGLPIGDAVTPMAELAAVYDFTAGPDGLNSHDFWIHDLHA